jgi:glutathione S-transferase
MKLYNFFRSSASYRVRIAMALKGLSYDNASINLGKGEQHQSSYGAVNPQEIVPTLEDNGRLITQSLVICEYLDETHPNPPILPDRHRVSIANVGVHYILDRPAVAGVIVGARLGVAEHLADNARVFSFALDDADRARIETVLGKSRDLLKSIGDCGDEYR